MVDKPNDIEAIYNAALDKASEAQRAAYLDAACGNDSALRARVEALLKAHDQAGSFLEVPALEANVTLNDSPLTERPGTVIGPYKLLEMIGEGGMALVYMAEQTEPLRRRVALKIIKLGMDTKQVIARFEAERQALAMMEHPNIAKVLDAGATETGRPYFVMELVRGVSITEYCDEKKLSTKERLDLFIQVCSAVQHAHQKGIIHRVIKPTNVMVTLRDGKAVPKVIDFGIAKATSRRLTEKTLFTRYAHIIGTPAYMSPEQAEFSEVDIDTRTDIYSLGVLLYELLTGATPFSEEELREAGYVGMQRIIREEDPVKPSTRLTTLGETLPAVAEQRRATPDLLAKLVRGDLDWIVMKSLEKDRSRRYETAAELAGDVKRHLNSEPVLAAAPSKAYRLHKFITRHRLGVIAGLVVAAALLIGATLATIGLVQANIQRRRALVNFERAYEAVDEMTRMAQWRVSGGTARPQVELQRELVLRTQEFYRQFLEDNKGDPRLREKMGRTHRFLGDLYLPLGENELAEQAYLQAIDVLKKLETEFPHLANLEREVAVSQYGLGFSLKAQGRLREAEEAYLAGMALSAPSAGGLRLGSCTNLGMTVNTPSGESGPCSSADGLSLFFHSNRAAGSGGWDLWVTRRQTLDDEWAEPENLGPQVNSSAYDGFPCISSDGLSVYFESSRSGGFGGADLWVTKRETEQSKWNTPTNLGPNVNGPGLDGTPSVSADGLTLFFESNRRGGSGGWDLWMTTRPTKDADWGTPVNLGGTVNSPYLEQTVDVSADGLLLVFGSNRSGSFGISTDLWMASRSRTSEPWGTPVNLGPNINTAIVEACPNISPDGSTLYFASARPGGQGSWDLWEVSVIERPGEFIENSGGNITEKAMKK